MQSLQCRAGHITALGKLITRETDPFLWTTQSRCGYYINLRSFLKFNEVQNLLTKGNSSHQQGILVDLAEIYETLSDSCRQK